MPSFHKTGSGETGNKSVPQPATASHLLQSRLGHALLPSSNPVSKSKFDRNRHAKSWLQKCRLMHIAGCRRDILTTLKGQRILLRRR
jgi:hypothetical protein